MRLADQVNKIRHSIAADGVTATSTKVLSMLGYRTGIWRLNPWVLVNVLDYVLNPSAIRHTDIKSDPRVVRSRLELLGIPVSSYWVDVEAFQAYLREAGYPPGCYGAEVFIEKALEHFVSLCLIEPRPGDIVIDVASSSSPFPSIAQRLYGCKCYRQDLIYPPGVREDDGGSIGGNAASIPIPHRFASALVLHCAYEMFEGDDDSLFIREASRVLQPGGRLVIIPLYLHEHYHILRSPWSNTRGLKVTDRGAKLVYRPGFGRVRFARFYDVEAFQRRVLTYAAGLAFRLLYVENEKNVDSSCYLKFIAVFERSA